MTDEQPRTISRRALLRGAGAAGAAAAASAVGVSAEPGVAVPPSPSPAAMQPAAATAPGRVVYEHLSADTWSTWESSRKGAPRDERQ